MDQLTELVDAGADPARLDPTLAALLAPGLAPLFARPSRVGVDSAWHGHVPFAHWIVRAARPRLLVELGTQGGVSYAAFCDSVLAGRLDTRCYAVDTWTGDEHAGFYGPSVFEDFAHFHDARYAGFSRLLRCAFDEALRHVVHGSVDLLHIDGRHRYEDVAHDFASWLPKLSPRAVVLLHDTNVRDRDFGVWRYWSELRSRYPSFEFLHAHGLGVLAVGESAPDPVAALCRLTDREAVAAVRERVAVLGERWALAQELAELRRSQAQVLPLREALASDRAELGALLAETSRLRADNRAQQFQLAELRNQLWLERAEREALRTETAALAARAKAGEIEADRWRASAAEAEAARRQGGADARAALDRARESLEASHDESRRDRVRAAKVEAELGRLLEERAALLASLSWRLTRPLRATLARLPAARRQQTGPILPAIPERDEVGQEPAAIAWELPDTLIEPAPSPPVPAESSAAAPDEPDPRPRILFVSGEPETPGHHYRVLRPMQLAEAAGWRADWSEVAPVGPHTLAGARLVVLWRVPWSPHVQGIIDACGEIGARVLFDIDDLVFKPELARTELIDGIRTTRTTESAIGSFFAMINRALDKCELATCTTEELAQQVRSIGQAAVVIPNGFDDAAHALSRRAVRQRRQAARDGEEEPDLVRIGYASGSRTHQRDFGRIAGPLAAVLRTRPQARLVLFRDPESKEGVVLLQEFPEFRGLEAQVEWRDMVPLPHLPGETARFDISLAPLEDGNVFCEAKSELKYFEAALVEAVPVATPTGPMRRAVRHGETGYLAETEQEWHDTLLRLVDDPDLRARVGRSAYHDALWRFGPRRREEMMRALLEEFEGGAKGARAFELKLHRREHSSPGVPHVPEAQSLFVADALREALVTVVVPVYNYAGFVLEALESVRTQSLDPLDLVIVDDESTDDSADLALEWARRHANRFNRVVVQRHRANAGLGFARNSGFALAETPFVLPLDADNRLRPECCARLAETLARTGAAFAYPSLQQFGERHAVIGDQPFAPSRLVSGNYIDAMALVAKWAWAAGGGYDHVRFGWEDYDFWCRLVELGLWGEHVPQVLADYRVHQSSMLTRSTDVQENKRLLIEDMHRRHPWLRIATPG